MSSPSSVPQPHPAPQPGPHLPQAPVDAPPLTAEQMSQVEGSIRAKQIGGSMMKFAVLVAIVRLGLPVIAYLLTAGGHGTAIGLFDAIMRDPTQTTPYVILVVNFLVVVLNLGWSIRLMGLGFKAAASLRGRARTGGILTVVTLLASIALTFAGGILAGTVVYSAGMDLATAAIVVGVIELVRVLLVGAALIVSARMVQSATQYA